ncbi:calcium-binding protein [Kordiimonas aquimaris]|uniref:calcium-binding protein n=1 Tax=Kordiimonas aquimaris TaxID=707591 RepID=UPI0021D2CC00|nr:hypothetical protein [Kordiimonas aquimaris]
MIWFNILKIFLQNNSGFVNGSQWGDILNGSNGDEFIVGGGSGDIIRGFSGNDLIVGGGFSDGDINQTVSFFGHHASHHVINNLKQDGDDLLVGGYGHDTIIGAGWHDGLVEDNGKFELGEVVAAPFDPDLTHHSNSNVIYAGPGNDLAVGANFADIIEGSRGNDKIYGLGGHDILNGGSSDTSNNYYDENDTIDGGSGDDLIIGGSGNDFMTGGQGSDIFSFGKYFGRDEISDFGISKEDQDKLDLSDIDGLSLSNIMASATYNDEGTTLNISVHGTITLLGIDQIQLEELADAGQILL